ncbi:hypothetical protein SAMN06272735_3178 [Streptomyces sp. TLI_55]|uniref:Uncharacterized protein n=1 Tax=Streptomyces aquilus TaxID=2548456 RepID=A0A3S9I136_9ACTN|nr:MULTISPECIES: hypothetical protein [Streptomyces]AZP18065.1 hypothetical protein EJC51_19395 [Streptomyces aquilus]SNX60800.1 hypothetical protein SAMN06272735_3178 [Streptomyces sp. TLI_55]
MSSFTPPPPARPPAPPRRQGDAGAAHKWQAIAALISAGVGALTFAVGFIGLPAAGVTSPVAVRETVTATVSVTTTATPQGNPGGGSGDRPSPQSESEPEVQWSGPLLSQNQGFDLDLVPPAVGDDDIDPWGFDGQKVNLIYNNYALVPEGEEPGFSECKLLATTKPQSSLSVGEGRSVCLFTDGGRVALVRVDSLDPDSEITNLTVKVWDKASSA